MYKVSGDLTITHAGIEENWLEYCGFGWCVVKRGHPNNCAINMWKNNYAVKLCCVASIMMSKESWRTKQYSRACMYNVRSGAVAAVLKRKKTKLNKAHLPFHHRQKHNTLYIYRVVSCSNQYLRMLFVRTTPPLSVGVQSVKSSSWKKKSHHQTGVAWKLQTLSTTTTTTRDCTFLPKRSTIRITLCIFPSKTFDSHWRKLFQRLFTPICQLVYVKTVHCRNQCAVNS